MSRILCMAAMCVALSACGELAYKMGGNTAGYQAAGKICASESDGLAYKDCMKAKGWTVVGIDGTVEGTSMEHEIQGTPPMTAESDAVPPQPPSMLPTAEDSTTSSPVASPAHTPAKPKTAKPAPAPLDPNEIVTVQSWWKFGASDFKGDLHACTAKLGVPHHYDEAKKTATRGLVGCLRSKGWRAY